MKKFIVILGVLFSSTSLASTNWLKITENEEAALFLDKNSIVKSDVGNVKQANLIVNYKKRLNSTVTSYEIDCNTKKDHRIKISDYDKMNAQGKFLGSMPIIEPMEKADQIMVKYLCH